MDWRFNVTGLLNNYDSIIGWNDIAPTDIPTLFVKGGDSDYLMPEHQAAVKRQFNNAKRTLLLTQDTGYMQKTSRSYAGDQEIYFQLTNSENNARLLK